MSKILVISDLHLRGRFNRKKFELLRKLIEQCDLLIVNGDFYEEYAVDFEEFLRSDWKALFPLMLSRQAVCLIGNHDAHISSKAIGRFCVAVKERHELESGGVTFVFMHGHCCRDENLPPSRTPKFLRVTVSTVLKFLCWVFHEDHLVIYQFLNTKIKEWKAKNLDPDQWLITGHTHYAEIDEKARYANSGLVLTNKIYNYLLIENGKITLRRRK